MTAAELADLYEYNKWAHERTLDAAGELDLEKFEREVGGSFSSLRATLQHILATEVVWLSRWEGHSLGEPPAYVGMVDVASLRRMWSSFWNRQFSFINSLADDELSRPIGIRTRTGIETVQPLGETMVHVVNHSTYHRGQAASQVRMLGGTPRGTDYFLFCVTRGVEEEKPAAY
jgi:uncharacterized damage-inducible protein DinB